MAAAEALGSPRDLDRVDIEFVEQPDPKRIQSDQTVVAFVRSRLAGRWAIAKLAAIELVLPAADPGGTESNHDRFAEGDLRVGIRDPGGGFGVLIDLPRPALAAAYVRSLATENGPKWFLDPDCLLGGARSPRAG